MSVGKTVYAGLDSSGKSLKLATVCADLVARNEKWLRISGIMRPIASNLKFSKKFEAYAASKGIKIIYWTNLDDLIKLEQCDVIIDEIGNYFDALNWADLSLDVRRWITQAAKVGIEMYCSAQDFAQVDKSFRRLTNELYEITKIAGSPRPSATKPPVKRIWGLCLVRELDPRSYKEDDKKFASNSIIPAFFTIRRKYCEIFDTTQKIDRGRYPALRHEVRMCEHCTQNGGDGSCTHVKIIHV